jgi:hypothetical protein
MLLQKINKKRAVGRIQMAFSGPEQSAQRPDRHAGQAATSDHESQQAADRPFGGDAFAAVFVSRGRRTLLGSPERDLFATSSTDNVDTLVSASLGFIWQLARRNPYALRLICGASVYWTECIAERTFYELLDAVHCSGDTPCARLVSQQDLWRKLLSSGVSREAITRHAAQVSALQAVLTDPPDNRAETWPLAARVTSTPRFSVAEEKEPGNS